MRQKEKAKEETVKKQLDHRTYALKSIAFIDEDAFNGLAQLEMDLHQWREEMGWLETLATVEALEEKEAAEELFSEAA